MNWSRLVRHHAALVTAGGAARWRGWNAQCGVWADSTERLRRSVPIKIIKLIGRGFI
jgi:hypothetical protein